MTAQDKDNYMRLLKQSSEKKHIYENEDQSDMVWRIMQKIYGLEMYNKVKADIDMDIEEVADEEFIYRYKLLPETFV